ncbi:unnamed protein product [Schistocephalus solidus]|uniref:Reverse transcriptase domain-containing protein n=1 Tax=Schistocephalus solidus TaxID=70667 RepID=A0A183T133_SCHSO|nr:unnamed protein product [Schistocephalus solidus]
MQPPARVSMTTDNDLLFVDDCTHNIVMEEDMQKSTDLFVAGCANLGLTISTAKTVVMPQPPPNAAYNAPQFNVNDRRLDDTPLWSGDLDSLLEPCQEAESLPSQLPPQNTEAEMARPSQEAESLSSQLPPQNTEAEMARQIRTRKSRTGILSIHAMLRQGQLRCSKHLVRMDDERLPKQLFYGKVATGARRQGGQKRHCKDSLKKLLKELQINPATWKGLA